jgi:pyroglutamyl-peptidase
MESKGIILLTGYEAFGDFRVNPSIAACMRLDGKIFNGYKVVVEEISMDFTEVRDIIEGHLDKYRPAAVISTGVSREGASISLERVAINITTATGPSEEEELPTDEALRPGCPAAYLTTLPLWRLLEGLKTALIPAVISNSAGTLGCNQIFYQVMDYLDRNGMDIPAGFIHVPRLPEQALDGKNPSMTLDLIARALEIVVELIAKELACT